MKLLARNIHILLKPKKCNVQNCLGIPSKKIKYKYYIPKQETTAVHQLIQ